MRSRADCPDFHVPADIADDRQPAATECAFIQHGRVQHTACPLSAFFRRQTFLQKMHQHVLDYEMDPLALRRRVSRHKK